jgi:hypothetical protein
MHLAATQRNVLSDFDYAISQFQRNASHLNTTPRFSPPLHATQRRLYASLRASTRRSFPHLGSALRNATFSLILLSPQRPSSRRIATHRMSAHLNSPRRNAPRCNSTQRFIGFRLCCLTTPRTSSHCVSALLYAPRLGSAQRNVFTYSFIDAPQRFASHLYAIRLGAARRHAPPRSSTQRFHLSIYRYDSALRPATLLPATPLTSAQRNVLPSVWR